MRLFWSFLVTKQSENIKCPHSFDTTARMDDNCQLHCYNMLKTMTTTQVQFNSCDFLETSLQQKEKKCNAFDGFVAKLLRPPRVFWLVPTAAEGMSAALQTKVSPHALSHVVGIPADTRCPPAQSCSNGEAIASAEA